MLTKVVCMGLRNGPGFVASALGAIILPPHRYEGMSTGNCKLGQVCGFSPLRVKFGMMQYTLSPLLHV